MANTFNFNRNAGMLALAIYLILVGVGGLTTFSLPLPFMAILAIIAGILLLVGR